MEWLSCNRAFPQFINHLEKGKSSVATSNGGQSHAYLVKKGGQAITASSAFEFDREFNQAADQL